MQELEKRIAPKQSTSQRLQVQKDEKIERIFSDVQISPRAVEHHLDLPERDIRQFDCSPRSCRSILREFQVAIGGGTANSQAQLTHLLRFRDNLAETVILHRIVLDAEEGYVLARGLLHKRFGQNHMVARSSVDELLNESLLPPGDSTALIYLAQQICICDATHTAKM
ncbi:hypothetical protein PHET_05299 [Paragonimus heterotremus]|uniref:Uncharacterized protein n=1 Tax=Paragonimus heterotremus TaxID=100268 RepID=A0A8J4TB86_9TREM|nr:hypothetical protein PHET_05299 [Paragonimus heterotremus]